MKIAIVTAIWKRPEIFKYFALGIKNLIKTFPQHQFEVFIAGSEGQSSAARVTRHGFNYIEIPNEPLAHKHNASVLEAQKWNPDYVLCLGSDDIISPEAFSIYLDRIIIEPKTDFIGLTDFYFYDTQSNKALYWGGYDDERKGAVCGAGILLSSRVLDMWRWKPWNVHDNLVLDNSITSKLSMSPVKKFTFSLKKYNVLAVDIKSETNMTPFEQWQNTEFIDPEILRNKFNL